MVTRTETEQILRQAPFIESQQKDLLDLAAGVRDVPITQPTQQIAGLDPLTQQARGVGAGLGQYQPLLQQGRTTVGSGLEPLQGVGQGVGRTLRAGQGSVAGAIEDLGRSPAGLENLARAGGAFGASAGQFAGGPGYTAARFTGGPEYSAQQFAGGPGYAAQQFGGGPGYTAEGFDPSSISRFQNPFENQAVQQALADIRREGDIAANQQAAAAAQTGAFGGSRDILQRSELDRNVLEQQGRTAAQMRQAGFQNAAQQAQAAFENEQRRAQAQAQFGTQTQQQAFEDAQRRQQAQAQFGTQTQQQAFEDQQRRAQAQAQFGTQIGQSAFEAARTRALQRGQGLTGLGQAQAGLQTGFAQARGGLGAQLSGLGAQQAQEAARLGLGIGSLGTTQANIANLGQGMLGQQAQLQAQLGSLGQQTQQRQFDADYQRSLRQAYEPYQRFGWMSDILKPTIGTGQSTLTGATAPSPSGFSQLVGAGIAGLGLNQAIGNPLGKAFGTV